MHIKRTAKIFVGLISLYLVIALPSLVWPSYLNSPPGFVAAAPYLSIYFFHFIGIPGLLQHNGMCGWGWCAPTKFGWLFLATFWLTITWLAAQLLGRVFSRNIVDS